MARRCWLTLLAFALLTASGCARWVEIRPDQLAVLGGTDRGTGAELTGRNQAHDLVVVYTPDGRTVELNRHFDAMVEPGRGPTRYFEHPVRVRRQGDVLRISSANRPEAWIRIQNVRSVSVQQ